MIKKGKGKGKGIKYCVVREDPKDRWKKTMPRKPQTAVLPEKTPAAGTIEQRAKANKEYFRKHGVNLK